MNYLPPAILDYYSELARRACEETGHVCPFWPNREIMKVRRAFDMKYNTKLATVYLDRCHFPNVVYIPPFNDNPPKIYIRCRRNNYHLECFEIGAQECNFQNEKAAEIILKKIQQSEKDLTC